MKVNGPKYQADFIEVQDHLMMEITHCFIGPYNAQIFSLNNAEILIWPPDYKVSLWNFRMLGLIVRRSIG